MIYTASGLKMKESYYYYDKSGVLELSRGIRGGCYILSVLIWGIEDRQKLLQLFKILAFLETSSQQKFNINCIYICFHYKGHSCMFFFCGFFGALQVRVTHSVWWSWVMIGCRRTRSTKTSTQSGTRSSLCEWLLQYPYVCRHADTYSFSLR